MSEPPWPCPCLEPTPYPKNHTRRRGAPVPTQWAMTPQKTLDLKCAEETKRLATTAGKTTVVSVFSTGAAMNRGLTMSREGVRGSLVQKSKVDCCHSFTLLRSPQSASSGIVIDIPACERVLCTFTFTGSCRSR